MRKRIWVRIHEIELEVEADYTRDGFVDGGICIYHKGEDIGFLIEDTRAWEKIIQMLEDSLYEDGYDK